MRLPIKIELIDPGMHRPLQAWTFQDQNPIKIGRRVENDVVLADPYVSRDHARVEYVSGKWLIYAIGEQMIYSGGQPFREMELTDGVTFQLGARGCLMRFHTVEDVNPNLSTLELGFGSTPVLQFDPERLEQDVAKIANEDYFHKLQEIARGLRQNQGDNDSQRPTACP